MQDATISTIAQLLFSQRTILNFASLVADMDQSLPNTPGQSHSLTWDHEDIAMFDHQGSRITVAYADDLPGLFPACLTVSVGFNGVAHPEAGFAKRQKPLARMIVDRISSRYPPDAIYWHKSAEVVTSTLVDELIEALPARPEAEIVAVPLPEPQDHMADPVDMERILDRFEQSLRARGEPATRKPKVVSSARAARDRLHRILPRRSPAAAPTPLHVANTVPQVPDPMLTEAQAIRLALYAPDDVAAPPSTALRLATHSMNLTVMVLALPVGASMMTYTLLRGENLTASARMLALMGMAIGVQQSPFGAQLMAMI